MSASSWRAAPPHGLEDRYFLPEVLDTPVRLAAIKEAAQEAVPGSYCSRLTCGQFGYVRAARMPQGREVFDTVLTVFLLHSFSHLASVRKRQTLNFCEYLNNCDTIAALQRGELEECGETLAVSFCQLPASSSQDEGLNEGLEGRLLTGCRAALVMFGKSMTTGASRLAKGR